MFVAPLQEEADRRLKECEQRLRRGSRSRCSPTEVRHEDEGATGPCITNRDHDREPGPAVPERSWRTVARGGARLGVVVAVSLRPVLAARRRALASRALTPVGQAWRRMKGVEVGCDPADRTRGGRGRLPRGHERALPRGTPDGRQRWQHCCRTCFGCSRG